MNDRPGSGPGSRRSRPGRARAVTALPIIAAVTLLAAACQGSSAAAGVTAQARYQGAQAFARCMRSHGVPDFPDPSGGSIDLSHVDVHSPQFMSADRICQHRAR